MYEWGIQMIVSLLDRKFMNSIALPDKIRGQYILDNGKGIRVEIEGLDEKWYIKSGKSVKVLDKDNNHIAKCEIEEMSIYTLDVSHVDEKAFVFVEPSTDNRIEFNKYLLRNDMTIKIGRNHTSDIIIDNNYVSSSHMELVFKNTSWHIRDLNSSNGTFVNGKRISSCELQLGDVIYVMGTIIIIGHRMIAINNPDQKVLINTSSLISYIPQIIERNEEETDVEAFETATFYRSPRFKRDIEKANFKIDAPPSNQAGEEMPIMMTIGPSMTMGMASMVTAVYGVSQGNYMSAVTSGCMLLGTVLWPILSKKYDKKRRKEKEILRQEMYKEYLARIKKSFEQECERQRDILIENNVSISDCEDRIVNVRRNLWERSYGQNDFLKVTVGIGTLPMEADIQYPERKFELERDLLEEELLEMCEAPHVIENVPITVSLFEDNITGVIGARDDVLRFAKGLTLQLATLYSYDEVKFVFIYDEKTDGKKLDYVKWLPHIWDDDKTIRFLAKESDDVRTLSAYLEAEFELRRELKDDELDERMPYYVIFAFDKKMSLRADITKRIYDSKKNLHFTVINFFDELKNLPKECSNVIELCDDEGKIYNKDDITGQSLDFKPQIYVNDDLYNLSSKLSNIHLHKDDTTFKLPKMITFLEMYEVGKIEHLNILERWKDNDPTRTLEAQVGVDTNGDPFKLDLHEKYHGPHGLVAGMTGSGKSEFIMTYILSLAVNYHPDEVAFVLIDYKGGGMAKTFETLPHTAGIITNLDGSAITRSLISIQSELRRRQAIFAEVSKETGISNIDIYKYQKMFREGTAKEPLQHLFIISDEFAELKTQRPEFMSQLVSAARIGRSLGVHLILATQKPSGVVDDQIWSNAKFKACLKVQDKADSMDMLKRPEAAELQETGRFYLQVGYNEMFKLGQSAWSGAPYYPSDKVEKQADDSIEVIDNVGRVIGYAKMERKKSVDKPKKQIDVITTYLCELAEQENIKVRPLWLEPIPEVIYVDDLRDKYEYGKSNGEINPVIGEFDDPMNQRQGLLTLPLTDKGNVAVYGMAGSGKTTFITTIIYSMLESYAPEEVNIYILDFSAETLVSFARAPHVGDVVLAHEQEKVTNLIKLLLGQIETRKKLFADFGGDITSYNNCASEKVPSIVVAINNYAAFNELYEDYENEMLKLTREGTKYGIYFILTATGTNAIRFRMLQNIGQSYVLQLVDETDYTAIIGKTDGLIPSKCKGRGLCKMDEIYEFQTAYAFESDNQFAAIKEYCEGLRKKYATYKARCIPVLPDQVNKEFVESYVEKNSLLVPIGVETSSLEVNYFDLNKNYISFIQSDSKDYIHFMSSFLEVLANMVEFKTIVFDLDESLQKCEGVNVLANKKSVIDGIDRLFDTVLTRHNSIKDAEEEGRDIPMYDTEIYAFMSLADMREELEEEQAEKLTLILEKGSKKLNIVIIIAEVSKLISSYSFEKWYKSNASQSDGLWIGSGIADQYYLKLGKTTMDMGEEMSREYGYSVKNGKATKVKLLNEGEVE